MLVFFMFRGLRLLHSDEYDIWCSRKSQLKLQFWGNDLRRARSSLQQQNMCSLYCWRYAVHISRTILEINVLPRKCLVFVSWNVATHKMSWLITVIGRSHLWLSFQSFHRRNPLLFFLFIKSTPVESRVFGCSRYRLNNQTKEECVNQFKIVTFSSI